VNLLNFGQQLLGLTQKVNPWLWNPAQVDVYIIILVMKSSPGRCIYNYKLHLITTSLLL